MIRSILSLLMFLFVFARYTPARDAQATTPHRPVANSKGATLTQAGTPSLLQSSKKAAISTIERAASTVTALAEEGKAAAEGHLARVTAYWSGEGDYYTRRRMSSTGIRLHKGHCAVDPKVIPYGSVVQIAGLGNYLAVDTGTAVISRRAAREAGHNRGERNALVIDLYFENRHDGEAFAASGPKYAAVSWAIPGTNPDDILRSTPQDPPSEVVPKSSPLRVSRILASTAKSASKHTPSVALTKTSKTPVASAKAVFNRDTPDTQISSSPAFKGGTKVVFVQQMVKTDGKLAPTTAKKNTDSSEHLILAQADATSHSKSLYAF